MTTPEQVRYPIASDVLARIPNSPATTGQIIRASIDAYIESTPPPSAGDGRAVGWQYRGRKWKNQEWLTTFVESVYNQVKDSPDHETRALYTSPTAQGVPDRLIIKLAPSGIELPIQKRDDGMYEAAPNGFGEPYFQHEARGVPAEVMAAAEITKPADPYAGMCRYCYGSGVLGDCTRETCQYCKGTGGRMSGKGAP